jgi:Protein of unknown function (DUF4232)
MALLLAPLALMATSPTAVSAHSVATTTTTPLSMTVFGFAQPWVGFDGGTIRIWAETNPPPSELALSLARVWFGDGTSVTLPPPPCHKTVVRFPLPGSLNTPAIVHVYKSPGQKEVQIWARLGCGASQSLQYTVESVYVFRDAPAAAKNWAPCQAQQLSGSVAFQAVAMGSVRAVVELRNTSAQECRLFGYPRLQLVGTRDQKLSTRSGPGGAMMFPNIPPHLVALVPGATTASFDIDYGDNPGGSPEMPYAKACPLAPRLEVFFPGGAQPLNVTANIAPCGGGMTVSPFVPGGAPIPFN